MPVNCLSRVVIGHARWCKLCVMAGSLARSSIARSLLSLVVPPLCAACREPELSGAPVCPECAAGMQPIAACCRRCGAPLPCPVDACSECHGRDLAFERAWAPFAYTGPAREVVLALKGRGLTCVTSYMAAAMSGRAPSGVLEGTLVPAPAHPERIRLHGQNQARELADALGRVTGRPVRLALARRPGGRRQVGLERPARRANAQGIVAREDLGAGTPVVLVDDVYTTGSTLDACAAALRAAGSGPVTAVCFARTVRGAATLVPSPGAA
jgi:predicted amidophosphoribosyltransferase